MSEADPLYSLREVAELTNTPINTVRRWVLEKQFPVVRIGPLRLKRVRVHQSVIREHISKLSPDKAEVPWWQQPLPEQHGYVYFVAGAGNIKIGESRSNALAGRVCDLQNSSPVVLSVLGVIQCRHKADACRLERELHIKFASIRQHGEWFRSTPELLTFIRDNAKPWQIQEPAAEAV